jgi:tetratricopeptide (TPR) repeat protein
MARRINKRFLIIASSVVLVLGLLGGGAVAYKLMARKNPQPFIEGGHNYFAEGNWEQAAAHFYRAIQLKKAPDAELYMLLGDCFSNMTAQDMENLRRAIASYQQVLLIQPNHPEALNRLLRIARDEGELFPSASAFDSMIEAAKRVLAQYPEDVEARKVQAVVPILRWFAGVETDPRLIQQGIDELQALHEQNPADVEVMFNLARARLAVAQRARSAGFGSASGAGRKGRQRHARRQPQLRRRRVPRLAGSQ